MSIILFPSQSSILSVAFISIFFTPMFQRIFRYEEKKDGFYVKKNKRKEKHPSEYISIFKRHQRLIYVYSAFFIGIIVVFSFMFTFVPVTKQAFTLQVDWFRGYAIGFSSNQAPFERYFFNNTQVMLIFFALSVLFGAGATFILSWNASIIAVYLGMIAHKFIPTLGISTAYVYGISVGLSAIIVHAIPELLGYFFAGIAGGVLSVALIREKFMSQEFKEVMKDAFTWLILAEILIIIGALIESGL